MTEYVVFFDLRNSREHKIHRTSCQHYRRYLERKGFGISAPTTKWSNVFPTLPVARETTGVTRECLHCVE